MTDEQKQTRLLLGDEAVALAAQDSGIGAAYGYPGTPSTEILESLMAWKTDEHAYVARWSSNEKAAYEQALGASLAGRRAMVTMKHVGLNVAADPFMNSILLDIRAGFVLVVADDPGMHSSQNEQDSRQFAAFAGTVCLEPHDQQEAYDMTRDAFRLSEELSRPVMLRLVTRIAHSRAVVHRSAAEVAPHRDERIAPERWSLVPVNARRQWSRVVAGAATLPATTTARRYNHFYPGESGAAFAVVTAGIGRNYLFEHIARIHPRPAHVHIGYHPMDRSILQNIPGEIRRIVVAEDGSPFVERLVRAELGPSVQVRGRETGELPATGELTPDVVGEALGLAPVERFNVSFDVPSRPPQLCAKCPHADSFDMLNTAAEGDRPGLVASDIGCYSLGVLPPHSIADSLVCMGASIGMAKGAAEAGSDRVVATIGDSTFLHSGIQSLVDAAEANTPMTVIILDNGTVAMTGGQQPAASSARLESIVRGIGVPAEHVITLRPTEKSTEENAVLVRRELEYNGLSVIISRRNCVKVKPQRERVRDEV